MRPRVALAARSRATNQPTLCQVAATAGAGVAEGTDYDILKDVRVRSVSSDEERPVVRGSGRQLVLLLTHWGDLSSWEYAQQVRYSLPALKDKGVEVVAVGIGGKEAAKKFAQLVDFPEELLYYDPDGACCAALGCAPGKET